MTKQASEDGNDDDIISLDFEATTIALAKTGNHEAGMEALRLCLHGLDRGALTGPLNTYLCQCLTDLLSGINAERALNIEIERGRGKPKNPFPDWEMPLAAFGVLIQRRGYRLTQVNEIMSDARQITEGKDLDPKEARRIRDTYEPLQRLDDRDLAELCGDLLRGKIGEYSPCK